MTNWTHKEVFDIMEKWAPKKLAYDWDPVGLQAGSVSNKTDKILVSLDVTEAVADEAIARDANLIISHHPLLFKPLKSLDTASQKGKIIQKLIKHDITVYAAHTNLDIAEGGVNDILGKKINLQHTSPLTKTNSEALLKLVVYVPKTHTKLVREGLASSGAGSIGAYSHCTFKTPGIGSYMPHDETNPYIGEKNELTFVEEDRLETIIEEKYTTEVLEKLQEVHPYEEIAYDLYPVKQTVCTYGLGRIGTLPKAVALEELCQNVKQSLEIETLRFVGNKDLLVKKIAIIGGSGEKYINAAQQAGADVLITGDVSFHPAQDAFESGLSIIDPGHYAEKWMKEAVVQYLNKEIPTIDIFASEVNTDPFNFI